MVEKTAKVDHHDKRFGLIALEKGYITVEELIDALKIQVQEDIDHGAHRLIGEILMDQGNMFAAQVEEVLKSLFKR